MAELPSGATIWDADALSSLYVSAPARCNCGARWRCDQCRRSWIGRRYRSAYSWLLQSVDAGGVAWFAMLTIPTAGEWQRETNELWRRWRALGQQRTRERRNHSETGLVRIRRGIGALHLVNRAGAWQPHLHAVIAVDLQGDGTAIEDAWEALGDGFADVSPAASLEAVVRYSIAGELPACIADRETLERMMRGVRVVRRIGR